MLLRLQSIKEDYILDFDEELTPTEPKEFLDCCWDKYIKGCTDCPLHSNRTQVVKWDGIVNAPIMIILEGVSQNEDRAGLALVGALELNSSLCSRCNNSQKCWGTKMLDGPYRFKKNKAMPECKPKLQEEKTLPENFFLHSAGSILDGLLIKQYKLAYPRNNWVKEYNSNCSTKEEQWEHVSPFFITNATLCFSKNLNTGGYTTPQRIHWEKCRKWLACQWTACQPKIIICLGRTAMSSILGYEERAKSVRPNTLIETKWGPCLYNDHIAATMREPNKVIQSYGYAKQRKTIEMALNYVGLPI